MPQASFGLKFPSHHKDLVVSTIAVLQVVKMPGPKKDVFGVFRDPASGEEVTVDRYTLVSSSGVELQVGAEQTYISSNIN